MVYSDPGRGQSSLAKNEERNIPVLGQKGIQRKGRGKKAMCGLKAVTRGGDKEYHLEKGMEVNVQASGS